MKLFLRRQINKSEFFFCFLSNTVLFKKGSIWKRFELRASVFNGIGLVKPNNDIFLFKFFRDSEQFWNLFWKILSLNQNTLRGFFTELELIGLGFRIKKITNTLYRFFWGHANYVYLFVPNSVLVEYSHDERLIFFFSIDVEAVNQIVSYLLLLRKLSVYRVTGFVRPGKIIRLNSGKQR